MSQQTDSPGNLHAAGGLLVAIDDSPTSERAVDVALERARALLAKVTFVHAVFWAPPAGSADFDVTGDILTTLRATGNSLLADAGKKANAAGVTSSSKIVEMTAPAGILDAAKDAGADLIVVGTHSHGGLARAPRQCVRACLAQQRAGSQSIAERRLVDQGGRRVVDFRAVRPRLCRRGGQCQVRDDIFRQRPTRLRKRGHPVRVEPAAQLGEDRSWVGVLAVRANVALLT
jgi:nucleotide-binding universal stress UspA family protein